MNLLTYFKAFLDRRPFYTTYFNRLGKLEAYLVGPMQACRQFKIDGIV